MDVSVSDSVKSCIEEEHCCETTTLPIDKYLQVGKGIGRNLLAVGESPAGNGWKNSGRAFFTPNGKIVPTGRNFLINLQQIDESLTLETISFTEIAKCFVANNRAILPNCAAKTWCHFLSQIEHIQPKIMILLGQKTTEIFNKLADIDLKVGEMSEVKLNEVCYKILPIYHPSPLNPKRVQNIEFIAKNLEKIRELIGTVTD